MGDTEKIRMLVFVADDYTSIGGLVQYFRSVIMLAKYIDLGIVRLTLIVPN